MVDTLAKRVGSLICFNFFYLFTAVIRLMALFIACFDENLIIILILLFKCISCFKVCFAWRDKIAKARKTRFAAFVGLLQLTIE